MKAPVYAAILGFLRITHWIRGNAFIFKHISAPKGWDSGQSVRGGEGRSHYRRIQAKPVSPVGLNRWRGRGTNSTSVSKNLLAAMAAFYAQLRKRQFVPAHVDDAARTAHRIAVGLPANLILVDKYLRQLPGEDAITNASELDLRHSYCSR